MFLTNVFDMGQFIVNLKITTTTAAIAAFSDTSSDTDRNTLINNIIDLQYNIMKNKFFLRKNNIHLMTFSMVNIFHKFFTP